MQRQLLITSFLFMMSFPFFSACAQGWANCYGGVSNGSVYSVFADENDSLLYAGGDFNNIGYVGFTSHGFAALDDATWQDFSENYGGDFTRCIAAYNGKIYHGLTSGSVFEGGQWDSTRVGNFDGNVYSLAAYNGELYCAGNFKHQLDPPYKAYNFITKWDGTEWSKLTSGVKGSSPLAGIYSMWVYNDELYVGGIFDTAGNTPCNNIAKWDGAHWTEVGTGVTGSDTAKVSAFATYDGDLIVGGFFNTAGSVPAGNIAKWDGFSWSPMISAFDQEVAALTVYNNKLFAGGYFDFASLDNHIASWNGSNWSSLGNGMTSGKRVLALTVWKKALIVGGKFDLIENIPVSNIAIWAEYPVGISSPSVNDAISLWPNPASSQLFISNSAEDRIRSIEVMDQQGKRYSKADLYGTQFTPVIQLNNNGWANGIMIVRIVTENEVVNKKVIID